jgi:hypothetical protein
VPFLSRHPTVRGGMSLRIVTLKDRKCGLDNDVGLLGASL